MEDVKKSLEGKRVTVLNVEWPLNEKALAWNPAFNVPNLRVVTTQKKTIAALQQFAFDHKVNILVRFVTWDEAFGLLSAARTEGADALPDVAQVGSTWTAYLAGQKRTQSRDKWQTHRGNWRDVLGVPACALPFTNDVRLIFYWKLLRSEPPATPPLRMNTSSWDTILHSIQAGARPNDTLAFSTGVTLNLLHDLSHYRGPVQSRSSIWMGRSEILSI